MDLDTSEFRRYLDNNNKFNLQPPPSSRAARGSIPGLPGARRRDEGAGSERIEGGGGPIPPPVGMGVVDQQDSVMTGAADLDEIVNVNEMRRHSQANVFGVDALYLTDDAPFMMPQPDNFSSASMPTGLLPGLTPTTMDELMDLNTTAPDLSMYTFGDAMSTAPEVPPPLSMFPDHQSGLTPTSNPSPVVAHLAGSLPQSPVVSSPAVTSAGPLRPQLVPRSSAMSGISSGPDSSLSVIHEPGVSMDEEVDPTSMDTRIEADSSSVPTSGVTAETTNHPEVAKPSSIPFPPNVYSSSGFDMLDILHRVATRPNPQIDIGAVDMSCAFVVTDQRKYDQPIVYCSATFERLTGYTKHEVLGKNCRFLQAPDGQIKSGEKRRYVDENAVWYLKNQINKNTEAQTSLINYRKGGQSFTNLLTMIPLFYDSDKPVHYVGFQVDLVDQPSAMMNRNKDGSFVVNYQYSQLPTYMPAPASLMMDQRSRLTVGRDDVSHVLSSFGTGDSEQHTKRIMDKVLLENTDDVVHVLSVKGLFLYCSTSIRKVLEYEPHELVGTSLSGVCHPSDIVPVTRDLKDTSAGGTVNVVFRIRRKFSGYTWFESHGCLLSEQGKGRKCVILVGRERPVYVLQTRDIQANGGIGDNELWTKMSTSGMFLYVSSNVKTLLDREGEDLMGTSVQALMRSDSKNEISKGLESARQGKKATIRHEIQNKRGQFLQALTTLYPGDGSENSTPTFLVAQTRLLKLTRGSVSSNASNKPPSTTPETTTSSHTSTPSIWSTGTQSTPPTTGDNRSKSAESRESDPASGDDNMFEELKTTRSTSWQFELRQMQRTNKRLLEDLNALLANRKKRKRRKGADQLEKDCANCHTRTTPEWRRGPSGKRDLCNSCGLRYAKLQKVGRGSPRTAGTSSEKSGCSPLQSNSPMTLHSMAVELSPVNPTPTPPQPILQAITQAAPAKQNGNPKREPSASTPTSPISLHANHAMSPVRRKEQARRGSMGALAMAQQQQKALQNRRGSVPSTATNSTVTPPSLTPLPIPAPPLGGTLSYSVSDSSGNGTGSTGGI